MALSANEYTYTGGAQTFPVNFELGFIDREDIFVRINEAVDGGGEPVFATFTWIDDSNITVDDPLVNGDIVQIRRIVSKTELQVDFEDNADVTAKNLNGQTLQSLMIYQELLDGFVGFSSPADDADRAEAAALAAEVARDEAQAAAASTGADVMATAADRVATGQDAAATAADVIQTGNDAAAAATSASQASASNSAAQAAAAAAEDAQSLAEDAADAAGTSASAAAASEAAAAAAFDDFDTRYLGPKATPPTVDNSGAPLQEGALYFDTAADKMFVWGASAWIDLVGTISHATLDGLGDDDHPQYHNDARGDVRYLRTATGGTLNGVLRLETALPQITLYDTDQPVDEKWVDVRLNNGDIDIQIRTDAGGFIENIARIQRDPSDVSSSFSLITRGAGDTRYLPTPKAFGASTAGPDTANDAVFATMETQLQDREVDLEGKTWPVTHVPNLNARNGYFRVTNDAGNVDLSHAAAGTLLKATTALTHGLCNSTWAQHNACWDKGMREGFVAFSENNAHGVSDGSARPVIMRSRDGISWTREDVDLGFPCIVFGHRVYGGFQMLIVRDESGGANNGKFYLYGRQLAQRVELTGLSNVGAGDNRYLFTNDDLADGGRPLMLYETATVEFNGLPSNLGGLNLNTEDNVSYRSAQTSEFRAPSNFTSAFTHSGRFEMNVRESDWFHITFDGGETLGEAIESAGGGSGEPAVIHGISMFAGGEAIGGGLSGDVFASRGDFYVGVSGGQFNSAVAKILNIVDENNKGSVHWVEEIPGADAQNSEVTVLTFPGERKICGFARTEDNNGGQTAPAIFYKSDNADSSLGTVTVTDLPTGAYEDSPIPCCILGDDIVACASLERGGNNQRGERRMAILKASITDAFATGASAFSDNTILAEKGEYRNQTLSGGATGFGVPSISEWGGDTDKTVAMFWNQEANTNDPYRLDSVTQMMATKVGFDPNSMAYFGAEQIVWGSVPEPEWKLELRGAPATANGGIILWSNVDRESAPHGYDTGTGVITFPVSGLYRVAAQMSYEANTGSNYLWLRNEDDNAFVDVAGKWLAPTYGGGTVQSMGASEMTVKVKAGDTMMFRVNATAGTTNSSVRNYASIELLESY